MAFLSLAPPGYTLVHMNTISQDCILVSYWGFENRNVETHKHFFYGIPNIPIPDMTSVNNPCLPLAGSTAMISYETNGFGYPSGL
jgi:hypothetical protein